MQFEDLQLIEPLLRAVQAAGYAQPTPIQEQAIPLVMNQRDILGCAQTGTGKTAAFALPIIQRLVATKPAGGRYLRALVLAPTRELASQIGESFDVYGRFSPIRQITIFGGVNQRPQVSRLQRGADVLVATPGRLLDLMGQGYVRLDRLEFLVLDEADRMLDMGFIHDVRRIIAKAPRDRQTLLFSATMPPDIQALADDILDNPAHVAVTPVASTVEAIQQAVYFVEKPHKPALLKHLLDDRTMQRVLVFTRTKHGANKVVTQLLQASVNAEAIHGNKSQSAREHALAGFKAGKIRVLVATDIASRGIDVDNITHVVNYDLPNEPESYVHRIGRTGRAGASGIAYSFCDATERPYLRDIERLIQQHIPKEVGHPFESQGGKPPVTELVARKGNNPAARPQAAANNGHPRQQGAGQPGSSNGSKSRSQRRRNNRSSYRGENSSPNNSR
jgi:ATP-dependent RNA helicase RhlE